MHTQVRASQPKALLSEAISRPLDLDSFSVATLRAPSLRSFVRFVSDLCLHMLGIVVWLIVLCSVRLPEHQMLVLCLCACMYYELKSYIRCMSGSKSTR